jgi:hypothetical protein
MLDAQADRQVDIDPVEPIGFDPVNARGLGAGRKGAANSFGRLVTRWRRRGDEPSDVDILRRRYLGR